MVKFRKARFCTVFIRKVIALIVLVVYIFLTILLVFFKRINMNFATVEKLTYDPPTKIIVKEIVPESMIININTATIEDLMTLDGIGEKTALKIIEYRENNNGFLTIEEIKEVDGIGDVKFEKIKNYITVG